MQEEQHETALRAANLALGGQQRREASRFASIELRATDPESGPWEIVAFASVAVAAMLFVLGVWLL